MPWVISAETTKPTMPAMNGSATWSKPTFERTWPRERKNAAPIGRAKAHSGQSPALPPGRRVSNRMPAKMPTVPTAISQVTTSPSHSTPMAVPNSGAVEARVVDRVGPR